MIGIRGLGSAALMLAYVAAGRLDATVVLHIQPWDIAAGILLVREAGGFIHGLQGDVSPMDSGHILAANADLLPQMLEILKEAHAASSV